MKILINIIMHLMFGIFCFFIGGAYIQTKETKFGIEAKHNCNECLAQGCQGKYCYTKRIQKKRSEQYERNKKSNKFDKNRKIQKKELER